MSRKKQFENYMNVYDNMTFSRDHVSLILGNLQLADSNNCLREFLLSKKPYISFFQFRDSNGKTTNVSGGKDMVAIVLALNIYGANTPGFAARFNRILKEFANGAPKQMKSVFDIMKAQMELQTTGISLINFVDQELLFILNKRVKKLQPLVILLKIACLFCSGIGLPLVAMTGLFPIIIFPIAVMLFGFYNIAYWFTIKPFDDISISTITQPIGECMD